MVDIKSGSGRVKSIEYVAQEEKQMFTPGPWNQEKTGDGKRICIGLGLFDGPNGYDVAEVYCDDVTEETIQEAYANANLIAAAPDLYEALSDIVSSLVIHDLGPIYLTKEIIIARAALAKARGES